MAYYASYADRIIKVKVRTLAFDVGFTKMLALELVIYVPITKHS